MKEINIGKIITNKRREKGVTQGDLAKFIGVSKASVSKWEIGQSYPDITFLPQLATYFDISLDELMGYEPQMKECDIRKLYEELTTQFATQSFDEVMNRCRELTKKYYSCYPLLLNIGALYINYGVTCDDAEKKCSIFAEAKELLTRVKENSDDISLKQLALYIEVNSEVMLGNPGEVMALLENVNQQNLTPSFDALLSRAYMMTGRTKEAKVKLLGCILFNIGDYLNTIPIYLTLCTDDREHFDEVCRRTMGIIEIFKANELLPTVVLSFYITAAAGYVTTQNSEKALDLLEIYTEIATGDFFTILGKMDSFFSLLEEKEEELPYGIADLPRDEQTIKQSMIDAVVSNPAFSPLYENKQFQIIVKRLQNKLLGGAS